MNTLLRRIVFLAGIVLVLLGIHLLFRYSGAQDYLSLAYLKEQAWFLKWLVRNYYVYAVGGYILLFVIATLLFLPVTIGLSLVGGFLFGILGGTIYAVVGATIGSLVVFLGVRYLLGATVQRHYAAALTRINKEIKHYGAWYLLVAQLLPFTPTFLLNTSAGLTRMPAWTFGWATALGLVPGTFLYAIIGQQLPYLIEGKVNHTAIALIVTALTLITLVLLIIKRYWDAKKRTMSQNAV